MQILMHFYLYVTSYTFLHPPSPPIHPTTLLTLPHSFLNSYSLFSFHPSLCRTSSLSLFKPPLSLLRPTEKLRPSSTFCPPSPPSSINFFLLSHPHSVPKSSISPSSVRFYLFTHFLLSNLRSFSLPQIPSLIFHLFLFLASIPSLTTSFSPPLSLLFS